MNSRQRERSLIAEIEELRRRLAEPEETMAAIRSGEVDAFVVSESVGDRVYALRSADPPFRIMVEEMREGAATVDPRGTILYANGQLARLVHRPVELLRGSSLFDFVRPEDRSGAEALLANPQGGRGEITFRSETGQLFPTKVSINPVRDDSQDASCLIVTDLTQEKRETARSVAEETWKEANRRKDEFLAILSHELRNPLAAIGNASDILGQLASGDARVRWATEVIDRQVHHLGRMVDDLLDVSRIANGKIALRPEVFDLAALVSRVVDGHSLSRESRRSVRLSLPPEPVPVAADPTRVAQVIVNLLNNAEKFTRETGHIGIELTSRGGRAELAIRDDGVGIPAENLEKIFDLFAQIDRSLTRSEGGLGIGLTLVRELVELHGGDVHAESDGVGRGSVFRVALPLAAEQPLAARPAAEDEVAPVPARRVLVVEDHSESAESLAVLLRISGHEVEVAGDGPGALACCARFRPDLVLLDIGLPGMDGYEVARRLRELLGNDVRIVALTGYGQEEDRRRSADAGIDYHVLKPIRPEVIERLARGARADDASAPTV